MPVETSAEVREEPRVELGPVPELEAEVAEREVVVSPGPGAKIGGGSAVPARDRRLSGHAPSVEGFVERLTGAFDGVPDLGEEVGPARALRAGRVLRVALA